MGDTTLPHILSDPTFIGRWSRYVVQKITLKFEGVADGYCTNLFLTNGHSRPERSVHRGLTVRCRRPCLSEQSKSNSSSSWTELKCNSETLNLKSSCFLLLKNWIISYQEHPNHQPEPTIKRWFWLLANGEKTEVGLKLRVANLSHHLQYAPAPVISRGPSLHLKVW